jgi:hypothetical protein
VDENQINLAKDSLNKDRDRCFNLQVKTKPLTLYLESGPVTYPANTDIAPAHLVGIDEEKKTIDVYWIGLHLSETTFTVKFEDVLVFEKYIGDYSE